MKIMFVRPKPSHETIGLQHLMVVEPLELEILYALIRQKDDGVIIDLIIEKKPFMYFVKKHSPHVICFTGYITNVSTIINYCQETKKFSNNITTIVGGVHCEVCPEDFIDDAIDFRVVRNATSVFTPLLNHIENNAPLPDAVYVKNQIPDINQLPAFNFYTPFPARHATNKYRKKYFYIFQDKVALIKTSFGCPFSCNFCFCRLITDKLYFQRPMHEVIQELMTIKEKEVYIVDDDFLVEPRRVMHFIEEVKKNKINKKYLIYGRADFIANNAEIIHQFAQVGLRTVIVGFESFNDNELQTYQKKTNVLMYHKTMDVLNKEKIDCFATVIIHPHWDKNDFRHMVGMIKKLGIYFVNLQPLTPLPKTTLNVDNHKIIINPKDYEKWDLAHVSYEPQKMTVSEFYKEILHSYNAVLYHPATLWKYITSYSPRMLFKMLVGGYKVTKQYKKKIKDG